MMRFKLVSMLWALQLLTVADLFWSACSRNKNNNNCSVVGAATPRAAFSSTGGGGRVLPHQHRWTHVVQHPTQQSQQRHHSSTTHRMPTTTRIITLSTTPTTSVVTHAIDAATALFSSSSHNPTHSYDPLNNRHSASDWLYNVRSLPESKVLREIRNPVLSVFVWSLVVSVIHALCRRTTNHAVWHRVAEYMSIPGTAHSFLVSALGLLLVFRTNSAYQRFNEGRKIWENILSVSRNMSRMMHLYADEVGSEQLRRITNLVAAYPYLLRQHIRPGCLCSSDTQIPDQYRLLLQLESPHMLRHETRHEGQTATTVHSSTRRRNHHHHQPAQEMNGSTTAATTKESECWVDKRTLPWSLFMPQSLPAIARAENRPLWVCDRMAALICKIPYGPNFTSRERLVLLGMVDKLTNAVGQCERIHQTAVPLNYARHSLRSLTLWLFTLPFALVQDLGLLTAPANATIAWLFFGVYQIGYSIEDPFQGSLRLSILCDAIRRSVLRQSTDMRVSAYQLQDVDTSDGTSRGTSSPKGYDTENLGNVDGDDDDEVFSEEGIEDAIRRSAKVVQTMNEKRESSNKEDGIKSLHEEIQQKLLKDNNSAAFVATTKSSLPIIAKKMELTTTLPAPVEEVGTALNETTAALPSTGGNNDSNRSETFSPTNELSLLSTPLSIDEEMLATPKLVLNDGTWTEVGI